jgi:nucleoside-triphosphatase THEP1
VRIILVGQKRIGKTRVCERIVQKAKENHYTCCGILTHKSSNKLVVEDVSTCQKEVLAFQKGNTLGKPEGTPFCNFIFAEKALEFAEKALLRNGDLLVIDEFGPMELESKGVSNALSAFASSGNSNSIMVVRNELKNRVLQLLKCDVRIVEVLPENREELPDLVFTEIFV